MTSIKLYFNSRQILEAMRQKWWYFVINFIALFFAHPVAYLLTFDNISRQSGVDPNYLGRVKVFAESFFSMQSYMIPVLIVMSFSAALTSVVMFSYLHNRKEINFQHSLPVRRESLFISNYLAGAAAFIPAFLCNVVITLCCAAATGTLGYISWGSLLLAILQVILFYLVNYTVAVMAANLAGTVFSHICGILVLNFFAVLTVMVHYAMSSIFYTTYVGEAMEKVLLHLSPYIRSFNVIYDPLTGWEWAAYTAFIILGAGFCIWLYERRPSEKSGTPLIFRYSKPVLEYLIVLWGTAYMGIFFYEVSGIYFMLFGFAAGGLLTHMACEVVFHKDFKAMFRYKLGLLAFLAAFSVAFCVYYYDVTGYDTYLPKGTEVESIIFTDGLGDNYSYSYNGSSAYRRSGAIKEKQAYTDPSEVAAILKIAELSVAYKEQNQQLENIKGIRAPSVSIAQKYSNNNLSISVTYQMKNGKTIQRRYSSIPLVTVKEPFEVLYNADQYIKNSSSLFMMEETSIPSRIEISSSINQSEVKSFDRENNSLTDQDTLKLLSAVKQDLLARTFADMQTYRQVFVINYRYTISDENGMQLYFVNEQVPVYENDVLAIGVLTADFGMKDPQVTYDALLSSIEKIELYQNTQEYNAYEYAMKEKAMTSDKVPVIKPVVISDPAQIKEMMKVSVFSNVRYQNRVTLTDGSVSAAIVMKKDAPEEVRRYFDYDSGENIYRMGLQIKLDQLPAFAQTLLDQQ